MIVFPRSCFQTLEVFMIFKARNWEQELIQNFLS